MWSKPSIRRPSALPQYEESSTESGFTAGYPVESLLLAPKTEKFDSDGPVTTTGSRRDFGTISFGQMRASLMSTDQMDVNWCGEDKEKP